MKKTLLAGLVVALFSVAAQARDISSGTIMITGDTNISDSSSKISSSYGSETDDETKINLASFYFVNNNVGVGLVYGRDYKKTSDTEVTKTTMNMFGPGAGYNISLNQEASIMLHAEYLLASGTSEQSAGNADIDGHGYQFGGALNYFVNDNVAVTFGLLRAQESLDIKSGGSTQSAKYSNTSTTLGMTLFF